MTTAGALAWVQIDSSTCMQVFVREDGTPCRLEERKSGDLMEGVEVELPSFAVRSAPVRTCKELLGQFKAFSCFQKRNIPDTCKYVVLVEMQGISTKRDTVCVHFCFASILDLFSLIHAWKELQKTRRAGCFLMECTRLSRMKKWVIDVDGNIADLAKAGFLARDAVAISQEEAKRFEGLCRIYALLSLRVLRDIGFVSGEGLLFFSVCTRHRGGATQGLGFSKLSLHITLGVCATQSRWQSAWYAVRRVFRQSVGAFTEEEQQAVRFVGCADDEHVLRNSAGQNMSTLFASKPVPAGSPPQPLFSFQGLFRADLQNMRSVEVTGCPLLLDDVGKYWVVSMIAVDPFSVHANEAWEPRGGGGSVSASSGRVIEVGRKRKDREDSVGGATLGHWDESKVPGFVRELLLGGADTYINTTMESLKKGLPRIIPEDAAEKGLVYTFHVGHPKLCILRLIALRPEIHPHENNGCKVCVYCEGDDGCSWDTGNVRVFVLCYCANGAKSTRDIPLTDYERSRDAMRLKRVNIGHWREVFPSDVTRYKKLQSEGRFSQRKHKEPVAIQGHTGSV